MGDVIPLSKERIAEQKSKHEKEKKKRARDRLLAHARGLKW